MQPIEQSDSNKRRLVALKIVVLMRRQSPNWLTSLRVCNLALNKGDFEVLIHVNLLGAEV
jgi:hypothetical protein